MVKDCIMYLLFIGFVLGSLLILGDGQKCRNEYRYSQSTIKFGRQARVDPNRDVYYPGDTVRFRCPQGYHFESLYYRSHKEMWIRCLKGHRWLEDWPVCRGPLENVTCENEYMFATHHGHHWLNATVNEFHAIYSPKKKHYRYGQTLRFTCPHGSWLYRTKGLTVMATKCLKDSKWSQGWPMCKGRTCSSLDIKNGEINDKHKKLVVGIKLVIRCDPDFFLYGSNTTKCLSSLRWSGHPQECVTLSQFQNNCMKDSRVMRFNPLTRQPYCHYERVVYASNHYKIAVGISVPMAVGFIIFIVTASLYVKHQRVKMSREREMYRRQEQRDNCLLKNLPSYDEALKSVPTTPPPTFDEIFRDDVEQDHIIQPVSPTGEHSSFEETTFPQLLPQYPERPPSYAADDYLASPSSGFDSNTASSSSHATDVDADTNPLHPAYMTNADTNSDEQPPSYTADVNLNSSLLPPP